MKLLILSSNCESFDKSTGNIFFQIRQLSFVLAKRKRIEGEERRRERERIVYKGEGGVGIGGVEKSGTGDKGGR